MPRLVPLVVRHGQEVTLLGVARVVDENVHLARLGDQTLRFPRLGQIGLDVERLADLGRFAASARDDAATRLDEEACRREPDPAGRAGDDAQSIVKAEIHAAASLKAPTALELEAGVPFAPADHEPEDVDPMNAAAHALVGALPPRQVAELAATLAHEPIAAVYASPLRRALETAETVAAAHGLAPIVVDALREVDVGSWQGLTRAEVETRFPEQFRRWLEHGPGWEDGETHEQMGERVVAALRELARRHPHERVVVVTHGGPIRAALARAEGIPHSEARRTGRALPRAGALARRHLRTRPRLQHELRQLGSAALGRVRVLAAAPTLQNASLKLK